MYTGASSFVKMKAIKWTNGLFKFQMCLLALACVFFNPCLGFVQMIPDNVEVGSCAKPSTVENFVPEKYAGTWYHVQDVPNSFVKIKQCTSIHLTRLGTNFDTVTTGLDLEGMSLNQTATITSVMPLDPLQPKPFLKVISVGVPPVPYHILDTDYTHFACVYSCFEFLGLKVEVFFVLSRTTSIRKKYLHTCISAYEALGLDPNKLEPVNHGEICKHPSEAIAKDPEQEENTTQRPPEKNEENQGPHEDSEGTIVQAHESVPTRGDYANTDLYLYDSSYPEFGLSSYESYDEDPNYDTKDGDLPRGEDQGPTIPEDEEVDSFSDTLVAKAIGGKTRNLDRELRHEAPLKAPRLRYKGSRKGKRKGKMSQGSRNETTTGVSTQSLTTSTPLPHSTPLLEIIESISDVTNSVHSVFVNNTFALPTDTSSANTNTAATATRKSSTTGAYTQARLPVRQTINTANRTSTTDNFSVRKTAATTSSLSVQPTTATATRIRTTTNLPTRQTTDAMVRINPTASLRAQQTAGVLQTSTSIPDKGSGVKDFGYNNSSVSKVSLLCILICIFFSYCGRVLLSS